jgi:hypothetical protein
MKEIKKLTLTVLKKEDDEKNSELLFTIKNSNFSNEEIIGILTIVQNEHLKIKFNKIK